jgi:hypothetical protein
MNSNMDIDGEMMELPAGMEVIVIKWMSCNAKPATSGWCYVRDIKGDFQVRYWFEKKGRWCIPTNDGFQEDTDFCEWMAMFTGPKGETK